MFRLFVVRLCSIVLLLKRELFSQFFHVRFQSDRLVADQYLDHACVSHHVLLDAEPLFNGRLWTTCSPGGEPAALRDRQLLLDIQSMHAARVCSFHFDRNGLTHAHNFERLQWTRARQFRCDRNLATLRPVDLVHSDALACLPRITEAAGRLTVSLVLLIVDFCGR